MNFEMGASHPGLKVTLRKKKERMLEEVLPINIATFKFCCLFILGEANEHPCTVTRLLNTYEKRKLDLYRF